MTLYLSTMIASNQNIIMDKLCLDREVKSKCRVRSMIKLENLKSLFVAVQLRIIPTSYHFIRISPPVAVKLIFQNQGILYLRGRFHWQLKLPDA